MARYTDANRLRQHRYYLAHREQWPEKVKQRRAATREWYETRLSQMDLRCMECGEADRERLHFHHRDPSTKSFELARVGQDVYNHARILEEIAKCDVLCAACHSKHHWADGLYANRRRKGLPPAERLL